MVQRELGRTKERGAPFNLPGTWDPPRDVAAVLRWAEYWDYVEHCIRTYHAPAPGEWVRNNPKEFDEWVDFAKAQDRLDKDGDRAIRYSDFRFQKFFFNIALKGYHLAEANREKLARYPA